LELGAKVFEKSNELDNHPSEDTQSPWEKFTLALVEPNANHWFESYEVINSPEFIRRETGRNSEVISALSHIPRLEMGLIPSFEVDEDAIGEIQDITLDDPKCGRAGVQRSCHPASVSRRTRKSLKRPMVRADPSGQLPDLG
jgi:hypothetical protein